MFMPQVKAFTTVTRDATSRPLVPICYVCLADLAPAMLKLLDATVVDLKINNVSSSVANAQDLAFAGNASYDAVTFSLGLHFVTDTAK